MYIVHNLKERLFHPKPIAMSSNLNHLKAGVITTRVTNLISLDLFRKLLLRFGLLLALVVFIIARSWGQTTTVAYTQQLDQYDQSLTTSGSGGIFNNESTEVGMWMNGDNSSNGFAGNVLWKTFRVGSATSNTTRSLQVGDEFTIRVSTRGAYYGTIGISFNSGSIPTATWGNRISNRRISVQQDGENFGSGGGRGSFYYNNGNTTGSFSVTPNSERSDYTIKLKLTAPDRCNITVNSTTFSDVLLGGTAGSSITHYAIYISDDRSLRYNDAGGGRGDTYWKQTTQVQNIGLIDFGASNNSFTVSDILFNGLNANSTTDNTLNNGLSKSGTGTLTLSGNNTFSGATTISQGTIKLGTNSTVNTSGPLGNTTGGTTVNSGAVLDFAGFSLNNGATEQITLNGTGISDGGAITNSSATGVTQAGDINLNSSSRINATSGNINLSGTISGGSNVLYLGGSNNISISGVISGDGNTQNSTITSLYKNDAGILTLSNNNTYTGDTRIVSGALTVATGGNLGNGSDVFISSGATLNINNSCTVASVQETGTSNGGVISIASSQTLMVNGANRGSCFQNSISGAGNLTMAGSGTTTLALYGTQSYTGTTTITGGKISSGVILASTDFQISGGELELTADEILSNSSNFSLSGNGKIRFKANETINNLTATGGEIIIDNEKTLTINGKLNVSSGVTITLLGTGKINYGLGAGLELNAGTTTTDAIWPASNGPADVIINASGSTVTLHAARAVPGTFTISSGKLDIGNFNLTLASISGGSPTSYIQTSGTGSLIMQGIAGSTLLPIGNSNYNPVTINNTNGYNWTVKVSDAITTTSGFSTAGAVQRTWTITPSTNPTAAATSISFQFNENEGGPSFNASTNVQAFKRNDLYWLGIGSPAALGGTASARTFTVSGVNSFSDFGLANVGSPLPVTFTSLNGTIRNGKANLSWNIADEHNVDRYEVEESANGRQFQTFTQVDAASRSSYQAIDAQLHTGANYYRVKAVDIDGKLTYSKIIRLDNNSAVDNDIRVYPNPSRGELNLGLNIPAGNYQIRLINAVGQTVYQQPLTHEGGSRSMQLGLPKLSSGVYQVEVRGGVQKHVRTVRIE